MTPRTHRCHLSASFSDRGDILQLETFFTVSQQAMQFLLSAVMGAALGVVYDFFRVLRIVFPIASKKAILCLCDIIFMLICGTAVFVFDLMFCRGQVRFFCLLGTALGFILYLLSLGSVVTGCLKSIVKLISKVLQKVYSGVFAPAVKLIYPKKNK